ncbi:hypothetical protein HB779_17340 [Phyllobacterium sp. 628]|uniref:hyaluronate lyase N-terminal domain-containing protein n=1 Tax=Phyllobacterium sp. 628 TaxID=2718938 RepID=UPI00166282A9|nr:hypothetical protein [Phyllobacterium sp. 628]QND53455.1 hypothetical protein HB779_17340 [Phyllobacterium sp. 628]
MSTQVQHRRGTAAQIQLFAGAASEFIHNTTDKTIHVMDGLTLGGTPLAKRSELDSKSSFAGTRAQAKAIDITRTKTVYLAELRREGPFTVVYGDFTGLLALDPLEGMYLQIDGVPATTAALVRSHDGELLPQWFGGVGGGVVNDKAAVEAAFAFGWPVKFTTRFGIGSAITLTNKAVSIRGVGRGISGLVDIGVAANQYMLSIVNDGYATPVTMENFSFLTTQASVANALSVKFGAADAEFFRVPHRFSMDKVSVHGTSISSVGHMQNGFKNGIKLTNVNRPVCNDVIMSGQGGNPYQADAQVTNTVMSVGWDLVADYHATDPFQRAAPTDPVFMDCHVYSADIAWRGRGHWEGYVFRHCIAVLCNRGWDLATDTPPGVGGVQFPMLVLDTCHANVFREAVVGKDFFDVCIINPQLHKWSYAPAGYVSTAIQLTNCPRFNITEPKIFNLADGSVTTAEQFNGITLIDCNGGSVTKPQFSGVKNGVQLSGTTNDVTYERGLWRDLPSGAIEYQDLSTGANNRRKGVVVDLGASNVAVVAVTSTATDIVSIDLGTVWRNDEFLVEFMSTFTKDATSEYITDTISKASGSANVLFINGSTFYSDTRYALASGAATSSNNVRFKIGASGTCVIKLQARCNGGGASIAAAGTVMRISRV